MISQNKTEFTNIISPRCSLDWMWKAPRFAYLVWKKTTKCYFFILYKWIFNIPNSWYWRRIKRGVKENRRGDQFLNLRPWMFVQKLFFLMCRTNFTILFWYSNAYIVLFLLLSISSNSKTNLLQKFPTNGFGRHKRKIL